MINLIKSNTWRRQKNYFIFILNLFMLLVVFFVIKVYAVIDIFEMKIIWTVLFLFHYLMCLLCTPLTSLLLMHYRKGLIYSKCWWNRKCKIKQNCEITSLKKRFVFGKLVWQKFFSIVRKCSRFDKLMFPDIQFSIKTRIR